MVLHLLQRCSNEFDTIITYKKNVSRLTTQVFKKYAPSTESDLLEYPRKHNKIDFQTNAC